MLSAMFRFLARFAAMYVIIMAGMIMAWEILGTQDRDGGSGLAWAIFIAPFLSFIGAAAWPAIRPLMPGGAKKSGSDGTNSSSTEES